MNPSDQARQIGIVSSWLAQTYTFGYGNDPVANAIVCQLNGIDAGFYDITAFFSQRITAINSSLRLAWMDSSSDVKLWFLMMGLAGTPYLHELHLYNVQLAEDDQLHIIVGEAFTGAYSGTLLITRRA